MPRARFSSFSGILAFFDLIFLNSSQSARTKFKWRSNARNVPMNVLPSARMILTRWFKCCDSFLLFPNVCIDISYIRSGITREIGKITTLKRSTVMHLAISLTILNCCSFAVGHFYNKTCFGRLGYVTS